MSDYPNWVKEHLAWRPPEHGDVIAPDGKEWMRSRPECLRSILIKFPPSCVVKIIDPTHHCAGELGIVVMYRVLSDHEDEVVGIDLGLACDKWKHRAFPNQCEVLEYWNNLTPEAVMEILDENNT